MTTRLCRTIGELARCDGILIVSCRDCGRTGLKDAVHIRNSGIPERDIDSLRFKCTGCGSRKTLSSAYVPATAEAVSGIVNGEFPF